MPPTWLTGRWVVLTTMKRPWVFFCSYARYSPEVRRQLTPEQVLFDADRPTRYLTRATAKHLVEKMTGCFEPQSVVCLHMFNDILYIPLFLAIIASRATWTGTNPAYTTHELADHLNRTKAGYVVVEQGLVETALEAASKCSTRLSVIIFEDLLSENLPDVPSVPKGARAEIVSLSGLMTRAKPAQGENQSIKVMPDDTVAALMSTSGTTGLPKLACRSQNALKMESRAMGDELNDKPYPIRRLFCTPIFHAFSLVMMAVNALRYGHQTYVMRRFDSTFSEKVFQLQITETAATPVMLHRLAITSKVQRSELASLRLMWCGGATLTCDVRLKALALLRKEARIVQVWGMTEGGWFTTFHHPEDNNDGSVGRPLHGWEIKVSPGPNEHNQSDFLKGEIYIRGPQLMTEYYNDPEATRAAFERGWFKTGDIGYIQQGRVYLIDRVKNMIKVNGFQVAPTELEEVIGGHPNVTDCAVIRGGSGISEHPLVFLVSTTQRLSETDVRQYMLRFLARYKVSHCRVRFIDQIPRGETGKVLTHRLREDCGIQVPRFEPCKRSGQAPQEDACWDLVGSKDVD